MRGASMGILNVDHPEILDFIDCKRDGSITNFNLSVGITDKFMESVANDGMWHFDFEKWPTATRHHRVRVPARDLWRLIAEAAHACGDPGLIFVDRLQADNPVPSVLVNCTNPCGEVPLAANESCLLGSINLARMVKDGKIDWGLLRSTVRAGVRFLDNMIDVADYPLPQIEEATKATRKIGLGYTGLADMLIMKGLAYNSKVGRGAAAKVAMEIYTTAIRYSRKLAKDKGCFPLWNNSTYHPDDKRRNATVITVAPTGSVTAMAGCEGYGIEPIFAVAYTKETKVAGDFEVFSPLFQRACKEYSVSSAVMSEVARRGSCQGVEGIPEGIQKIFKGAQEILPASHIRMQAAIQVYVDNSTSKTINMPNDATVEDVSDAYKLAYNLNLKGITVFRDGCKTGVITVGEGKPSKVVEPPAGGEGLQRGEIIPRPKRTTGETHRLDTGCGKLYLTVNREPDTGEILETFITTGSDGGCLIYTEATSRLISLAIRGGIPVEQIIEQLASTHACPSYQMAKGRGVELSPGKSCASAIAKKLQNIIGGDKAREIHEKKIRDIVNAVRCDECGAEMDRAEGCFVCRECGYSRC